MFRLREIVTATWLPMWAERAEVACSGEMKSSWSAKVVKQRVSGVQLRGVDFSVLNERTHFAPIVGDVRNLNIAATTWNES